MSSAGCGGFVLRPGVITLAPAVLAVVLSALEERVTAVQIWSDLLDRLFLPSRRRPLSFWARSPAR
jgi:hypothetical protein